MKISEKFCMLEFQGSREATRQEVAEKSFKEHVRDFAFRSTLPCTAAQLSADSDIGQQRHLERIATVTGDKLGEVTDGEAHSDMNRGDFLLIDDGSPHAMLRIYWPRAKCLVEK
jgi:hypothetical protein